MYLCCGSVVCALGVDVGKGNPHGLVFVQHFLLPYNKGNMSFVRETDSPFERKGVQHWHELHLHSKRFINWRAKQGIF